MNTLRREEGFTLTEMLVTMMILVVVLFALYSIFDMSMKVFAFGNDKVEAVENGRLGLEKMEREVRAAYPYNKPAGQGHLFWSPGYPTTGAVLTANQITFGNDLDGNRVIECPTPEAQPRCETITYRLSPDAPYSLQRISSAGGDPQPVVDFVRPNGLTFTYLQNDGTTVATNESQIAMVRIELAIDVDGRTQTLSTDVALRNRTA